MGFVNLGISFFLKVFFNVITGYYFMDFIRLMLPFNDIEISEEKKQEIATVAFFTCLFWFVRLLIYVVNYFTDLPYKRHEREAKKRMNELQIEKLEREKENEGFLEDMEKLKNEK